MKFDHKKGFVGSLFALVIGTSCCWLTGLAIWLGGATVLSSLAVAIEDQQVMILSVSLGLALFSFIIYRRRRKSSSSKR